MIRISGGRFRGRQIECPKGQAVRPTTSFVRESVFSILGPALQGARFLDLFAGSGIVGIEALSRGAEYVHAVESTAAHCRILKKNGQILNLGDDQYEVTCQDVFAWAKRQQNIAPSDAFDVIFLDPPYALEDTVMAFLNHVVSSGLLASQGRLVWESSLKEPPVPEGLSLKDVRRYGSSYMAFFNRIDAN